MDYHYIFIPNDLETGTVRSFASLARLCKELSLPYYRAYRSIKKRWVFDCKDGNVVKAEHFGAVKRGRSF